MCAYMFRMRMYASEIYDIFIICLLFVRFDQCCPFRSLCRQWSRINFWCGNICKAYSVVLL